MSPPGGRGEIHDSLSTAPGFVILSPAAAHALSTQDRDVGGSREGRVFWGPAGPIPGGQAVGPDQHPVAWFTLEVAVASHRTVVFTCRGRTEQ